MVQILLDRITLGFSLSIPFKDFKCYQAKKWKLWKTSLNIGKCSGFHLTGMIEGFFWVWNFRLWYFFGSENFDLRGDFFVYSKQSDVVIVHDVIDETEDVLGCLECWWREGFHWYSAWDFFGGVNFCAGIFCVLLETLWIFFFRGEGWFLFAFEHLCNLKSGVPPPPETRVPQKKLLHSNQLSLHLLT